MRIASNIICSFHYLTFCLEGLSQPYFIYFNASLYYNVNLSRSTQIIIVYRVILIRILFDN